MAQNDQRDSGDNIDSIDDSAGDPFAPDSPSSESDAGLDDPVQETLRSTPFIDETTLADGEIDSNLPPAPYEEIPVSNLDIESLDDEVTRDVIRSPEMSDLNLPGEIDIEALGDDDLAETDLPADARLDPLED